MRQRELDNQAIRAASPALYASLSELGRQVAFPPDIPFQAAEARGKTFNATIGTPVLRRHRTSAAMMNARFVAAFIGSDQ